MDSDLKPGFTTSQSLSSRSTQAKGGISALTFYSSRYPHPMLISTTEQDTCLDSYSPVILWGMRAKLGWEGLIEQVAF